MKLHLEHTERVVDAPPLGEDSAQPTCLLEIMSCIDALTRDNGDALVFFADAPRWQCGVHRVKILVAGEWINGPEQSMSFGGNNLLDALRLGVDVRRAMERQHWKPQTEE